MLSPVFPLPTTNQAHFFIPFSHCSLFQPIFTVLKDHTLYML